MLLFRNGDLPGGFLGVDLFFALSGYLITDLPLRKLEATGAVSLVTSAVIARDGRCPRW